jgi:GAF domain-containing protein
MVGVRQEAEVLKYNYVAKDSIIYNILKRDQMYIAENTLSDPIMSQRPFVRRESIKSSVSLPLSVGTHKVGVMFVNYHESHHFTDEEIADVELFAHQAAIAIHNAQLYDQTIKRAAYLETFYEASKVFSGNLRS